MTFLDAETVHTVDAEDGSVIDAAAGVGSLDHLSHRPDGELHTGAGVNVGDGDDARFGADGFGEGVHHGVCGDFRSVLVQLDLTVRCARRLRAVPERRVGHVVVVGRRQDLLIGTNREPSIQDAQSHGGASGQGDVGRGDLHVFRCRLAYPVISRSEVLHHVGDRVLDHASHVLFHGLANRLWRRSDEQLGHVDLVAGVVELIAHDLPIGEVGGLFGESRRNDTARECSRSKREPCAY